MSFSLKSKVYCFLFSSILILLSASVFQNHTTMGANWTYPYFSGAVNFEQLFDWKISISDFDTVSKLSQEELREYKFKKTDDLTPSIFNTYGYVLVALAGQKLFPFLGDIQGVVLMQVLIHLAVCIFLLLVVFDTILQRYGFLVFYAANPLILHFVTFPFYYFWMFIPSAALVILLFKSEWRFWLVPAFTPLLLFSLLIRPTTLFLCVLFYVVAWYMAKSNLKRWSVLLSTIFFLTVCTIIFGGNTGTKSPWHTMYVGVGAYENNLGVSEFGDHKGYEYFYNKTGVHINTNPVYGNWNDPKVKSRYDDILKNRYLIILRDEPSLLLKNATVNMFQVYSPGYVVDRPLATLASTLIGCCVLIFLLYARQFIWITAILFSAAGFFWYFPPIPAYNFAAYLLLVPAFLLSIEKLLATLLLRKRNEKS
jgi:hypothetical protein